MKPIVILFALAASALAGPIEDFTAESTRKHGAAGRAAAEFLVSHMPEKDKASLGTAFLIENLDLAFQARAGFPWAAKVPDALFLNDVLPYAVFDEPRDPWRAGFLEKARTLVKDATTASEAAQALNRGFFKLINVHYHTGRKSPNQSPLESIQSGRASCTGLAIILVNACRAVGIPARAVGTPMWSNGRGNHTWVEIWDNGWHFTGADEFDPAGLDRGWFAGDASKAIEGDPRHAIHATSWKSSDSPFPMVWATASRDVGSVEVTASYAKPAADAGAARLGVRLFSKPGGGRMVAKVRLIPSSGGRAGEAETKAGAADLNDMPRFELQPGAQGRLLFTVENQTRGIDFGPLPKGDSTVDAVWTALPEPSAAITALRAWIAMPAAGRQADAPALLAPLTKGDAATALGLLGDMRLGEIATAGEAEMDGKSLSLDGKTLRWLERTSGEAPADGRSLWISMHGGGGAPAAVNDSQWRNQIRLYDPAEGICIAPRAPTDNWNLWHEGHIDPMFQRLVEYFVALRGVNPDKVYLMGYSAGGDGVWQLAPRMADRFAAAAMMAGHPNESSLAGLRNLPFAIFMGAEDAAYKRNTIAADKGRELDLLSKQDPGAYVHLTRIYEGLGHWMNLKDAEALPWMAKFKRNSWPEKIVWLQDDVTHDRFYWLQIPDKNAAKAGNRIVATVKGQTIVLEGDVPAETTLRLSDKLLDLDQAVTVMANGRQVACALVPRTASAIYRSLEQRADLPAAATALLVLP